MLRLSRFFFDSSLMLWRVGLCVVSGKCNGCSACYVCGGGLFSKSKSGEAEVEKK